MKGKALLFEDYSLTQTGEFGGDWDLRRYEKYADGHARFTLVARYHEEKKARDAYEAEAYRVEATR